MSLIIKDVDMPDSCYECLLFDRLVLKCKHLNKRMDIDGCRLGRDEECRLGVETLAKCKDCEYYGQDIFDRGGFCRRIEGFDCNDDDYCSFAVRKEDE